MKRLLLALVFLAPPLAQPAAASVEIGDDADAVVEALGKPAGSILVRDKTLLLYPRGEVTLKDGVVTEVDLMTPEAFEADQARMKREREEWLAQKEKMRAARKAEGESIKADKMTSSSFAALPAKDRVEYWRSFQIRYPEVDVSAQIAAALESYEVELKELENQERIARLEARVAEAEREAAAARLEAEKLRDETERTRRTEYGLRHYTDPVYDRRYFYRPPTVTIISNGHGKDDDGKREGRVRYYDEARNPREGTAERVGRILREATED